MPSITYLWSNKIRLIRKTNFLSILLYWLDLLNESKIYLRVTTPSGSFRPSSNADAAGPWARWSRTGAAWSCNPCRGPWCWACWWSSPAEISRIIRPWSGLWASRSSPPRVRWWSTTTHQQYYLLPGGPWCRCRTMTMAHCFRYAKACRSWRPAACSSI